MKTLECYFCNKESNYETFDYSKNENIKENPHEKVFLNSKLIQCSTCKTIFINPSPSLEELDAFYDNLHKKINHDIAIARRFPELQSRYLSQVLYLKNFVRFENINAILEIGSNITGLLPAFSYFKKDVKYFYFDQVDSEIIERYGGTRLGKFADNKSLNQDVKKGSIDLVHMSHSLEHVSPDQINGLIKTIHDLLVPGGYFFAEVPFQLEDKDFVPPHTVFFSSEGIVSLMERNRFTVKNFFFNDRENITYEESPSNHYYENLLGKSFNNYRAQFKISQESERLAELDLHMLNYNRFNSNPYQKREFIRILCRK